MELGKINTLKVSRKTDHGFYLLDKLGNEVLLPNAYVTDQIKIDDEIEVFIYTDSEDRLVATTERPYIQLNEFAVLKAIDINRFGAFMDWGLPKDLLVPFSEQSCRMERNKSYLVYLKKDEKTERLVGSNKEHKYVEIKDIPLEPNQEVELLIYQESELGMNAIVDGKYKGLIFNTDIHKPIKIGDKIKGYVNQVRTGGKIDLLLEPKGYKNIIDKNSSLVLKKIIENKGSLQLTDKSSPEEIKKILGISKKAFKKTIGNLYKQKMIVILPGEIKIP
jgi:predicted RNA-binding protein (virulence factor B family)